MFHNLMYLCNDFESYFANVVKFYDPVVRRRKLLSPRCLLLVRYMSHMTINQVFRKPFVWLLPFLSFVFIFPNFLGSIWSSSSVWLHSLMDERLKRRWVDMTDPSWNTAKEKREPFFFPKISSPHFCIRVDNYERL